MTVYNAVFRADQDRPGPSVSTGLPGISRRDLWLDHMLHLVPESPPVDTGTTYLWVFLDKPTASTVEFLDETTGLPSSTSKYVKFSPDEWGTYRVMLIINNGQYSDVLLCAAILDSSGLVMNRGWRIPAFKEVDTEANFPGQIRGYAYDWDFIFNDIVTNGFGPGGDFVAGGDLAGTELSQTVIGLRARSVASTAPTDGQILTWVTADANWSPEDPPVSFVAGGDLSGTETSQTVSRLQGNALYATSPSDGQFLRWSSISGGMWLPQSVDIPAPIRKKSYDLSAGEMIATTLLANAYVIGGDYFDPADWLGSETGFTRNVYFRAILSSSSSSITAYVSIYDKDGITNSGTPIVIASSILSTGNTSPTRLSVDLTAALGSVTSKGIIEAQLYVSAVGSGNAAICHQAKLDVEWT